MAINLLPTDLSPKGPVIKLAKSLKNIAIAGFVVFIISLVSLIVFLLFISTNLSSSTARQEQLKTSIKSLEQTEQRLVMVKDRLKYTKQVLGKANAADDLEQLKALLLSLPESASVSQVDIAKDKVELTMLVTDSSGVSQSLATLMAAGLYEKIILLSFGFNPNTGYFINLELSN